MEFLSRDISSQIRKYSIIVLSKFSLIAAMVMTEILIRLYIYFFNVNSFQNNPKRSHCLLRNGLLK